MKTTRHLILTASALLATFSAVGGPWLDRYWPLNDGDEKTFTYGSGRALLVDLSGLGSGDWCFSETYDANYQELYLREDADSCSLYDTMVNYNIRVTPSSPVPILTESLLESGGTLTTSTTVSQSGLSYPATFTVRVAKAGTVTVPAGTYDDCRSISVTEVAQVPGYGTIRANALTAYLAPGVGVIKTLIKPSTWAVLVSGTVAGAPVEHGSSQLTVVCSGSGHAVPDYTGRPLELTRPFTVTARPGAGYVFSNWVDGAGTVLTNSPTLRFVMRSNLVLQANFIPNPFLTAKGSYSGLFYETNATQQESSGVFRLSLTGQGTYSASLQIGNKRYPLAGWLDVAGTAGKAVPLDASRSLSVAFAVDLAPGADRLTGAVRDGVWTAQLSADRAVFDARHLATNFAGQYTLVVPGTSAVTNEPCGEGYAAVTVDALGRARLSGSLADGVKVVQSAALSKDGGWPLYLPLYAGQGCAISWMVFKSSDAGDCCGRLVWLKPALSTERCYSEGFAVAPEAVGSRYCPPSRGCPVLGTTNLVLVLGEAGLERPLTNFFTLHAGNLAMSTNRARLKFTTPSGLFNGSVPSPTPGQTISFGGVLMTNWGVGCGYFLATNQSGRVLLMRND